MRALWFVRSGLVASALAGCALALSGCLPTDPPEGVLACASDAECPSGWACAGSRCWRTAVDAGPRDAQVILDGGDAGSEDAGTIDAAPIDATPGDGGSSCGGGLVCAAAAPLGWSGPIVLVTGADISTPPTCPAMAPATAFTTRSGMTADPQTCGCTCAPPPEGSLSCGSASIRSHTDTMCIIAGTTVATLADGACTAVSLPTSGRWTVSTPPFSAPGASCTAVPSTAVPPVGWGSVHRACGFGTPSACGDSLVCVPPRSTGERLCVFVDGDATCPASFSERITTAEDADDTRGCSACTCGAVTGSCGGHVDITDGCPGSFLYERIAVGGCTTASSLAGNRANASYTPTASCPPSAVSRTGTVTPTTVRTVCCLPE